MRASEIESKLEDKKQLGTLDERWICAPVGILVLVLWLIACVIREGFKALEGALREELRRHANNR